VPVFGFPKDPRFCADRFLIRAEAGIKRSQVLRTFFAIPDGAVTLLQAPLRGLNRALDADKPHPHRKHGF
jgi:hypothetical protein